MDYFNKLLVSRKNTFEIDVELQVRKILESISDYHFEFQKNEDKYNYDISVFRYDISGAVYTKKCIAFVEIEVSETWKDKYPENWHTFSFLKRKVFNFDYDKKVFTKDLHENADKTIYIILNKSLTDAICCNVCKIATFKDAVNYQTGNLRNDTFLRTQVTDKSVIKCLDNCLKRIHSFILNIDIKEPEQLAIF